MLKLSNKTNYFGWNITLIHYLTDNHNSCKLNYSLHVYIIVVMSVIKIKVHCYVDPPIINSEMLSWMNKKKNSTWK